ncbi:MAG: hypothetical protein GKR94_10740 [Gammaproteobacteria bacterium]|nr:hypothetical protein [Gammaproteobacteria bacterium]
MTINTEKLLQEATESLERIQKFDVSSLPRESELGSELHFAEAVKPAELLIELYQRLSVAALQGFPDQTLGVIRDNANNNYQLFSKALEFKAAQQNPQNARNSIIKQINDAYQPAFQALHPFISYSLHRAADFQRLDSQARATLQSIKNKADDFDKEMEAHKNTAKNILDEIRSVAAEQGVSQQAHHFKEEAEKHEANAETWRSRTTKLAIGLGVYSVGSLFIHKVPGLDPSDTYQSIQLVTSKVLIFGVIAYMLFLSARNFLSHKHNAILNKHRQNALLTFKALTDAAKEEENRDIVLNHASSCIFSPQDTGYVRASRNQSTGTNTSLVELLPKTVMKVDAQ